jgi:Flp pilus assembly protein TadB
VLGWLTQLAGLALGLLTASMFVVGALLAGVWVLAFALGKRLDSQIETSPESGDIT